MRIRFGKVVVLSLLMFLIQGLCFGIVYAAGPNLNKYAGVYILPEEGEGTIQAGELLLKVQNNELVGAGEQRIMPMGASIKTQLRIYDIKSNGTALYERKYANFDREGSPLQDGAVKGKAALKKNGFKLDKEFYKKK